MLPDCAEKIKQMVTMQDIAEMYGFAPDSRSKKALCPFHNDRKPSMQIYPGHRGYYCFVCGAGGDCINFVQRLFGLSFIDACKKINDDFLLHLDIDGAADGEARKEAERAYLQRIEQKKRFDEKRKLAHAIFDAAYNRFAFLDILMEENKPLNPKRSVSPEYIYACKHIDEAWNDVQEAADAIRELEKSKTVD